MVWHLILYLGFFLGLSVNVTSKLALFDNKNLIIKPNLTFQGNMLATFLVNTFILAFTYFNLVQKCEIMSSRNVFSVKFSLFRLYEWV